jgi:tight adherence protein C
MLILERFKDIDMLTQLLIFLCAAATIVAVALPYLSPDLLQQRMKSVALERERLRQGERDRLARARLLRSEEKPFMKRFVAFFRLAQWLGIEDAAGKLAAAGFRGVAAETTFIFFRAFVPISLFLLGFIYLFFIYDLGYSPMARMSALISLLYIGIKVPELYLDKVTRDRRETIRRAFPDALDLLLICVEAGISIEHAFRRVSQEIGRQSVALAEELTLTTAELSFLPDRRIAYENLARRVNIDSVRQIVTVLNQAERYGTPLASALRTVAQESRDMRMAEAEKKAAALPPKLTVPMIVFFLPVLFVVILGPAAMQAAKSFF